MLILATCAVVFRTSRKKTRSRWGERSAGATWAYQGDGTHHVFDIPTKDHSDGFCKLIRAYGTF
jgi:hypothetical protein